MLGVVCRRHKDKRKIGEMVAGREHGKGEPGGEGDKDKGKGTGQCTNRVAVIREGRKVGYKGEKMGKDDKKWV